MAQLLPQALVTFRSAARAQQPGRQIVGYLSGSRDPSSSAWAAFQHSMREVGYIVGQNVSFEIQSAEDQYDRLPALAQSLVDRHVSVIVALPSAGVVSNSSNIVMSVGRSTTGRKRRWLKGHSRVSLHG